jgi:hypothetical protein
MEAKIKLISGPGWWSDTRTDWSIDRLTVGRKVTMASVIALSEGSDRVSVLQLPEDGKGHIFQDFTFSIFLNLVDGQI